MSSSTKLRRTTAESLSVDLLLEIVARSDAATVVRCAATSKTIRHAIQDASFFRRRVALRDDAGDALLLGVSYAFLDLGTNRVASVGQTPPRRNLTFDAGLLESFEPTASRRGLIVLRRRDGDYRDLLVCNTLNNGHAFRRLPPSKLKDPYHALLTVDDEGRSFKLLVADELLLTMQVFSTEDDRWGAVVEIQQPLPVPGLGLQRYSPHHFCSDPLVLGDTAIHWLHKYQDIIVALDVNTALATLIELPPGWGDRVRSTQAPCNGLQLAASADGRLSLLVAECYVISMWTRSDAATSGWNRQAVIKREAIGREQISFSVRFLGFGELSSTVVLQMPEIGLVQINLKTKEALVLSHGFEKEGFVKTQMCLHETYLPSLLRAMKAF